MHGEEVNSSGTKTPTEETKIQGAGTSQFNKAGVPSFLLRREQAEKLNYLAPSPSATLHLPSH